MSVATTNIDSLGTNIVILVGEVTSPLVSRTLTDGSISSSFDLATVTADGRLSVPVVMEGESAIVAVGAALCVVGVVRRRFFRTGTAVASRTEVLAQAVQPVSRRAQVRKSVTRALANLPDELTL
jgi:hypothetical protein